MTAQIPDTCLFDGRHWDIQEYNGNMNVIPSNTVLGIHTITESTANWSGRIDHYIVYHERLYLFKIHVVMPNSWKYLIPRHCRRELVIRTERMIWTDSVGTREKLQHYRIVNLIFDDLIVYFTGDLIMEYPHYDPWSYPQSAYLEDDLISSKRATLSFEFGTLVDSIIQDI
jgi:hypothetical protein